MIPVVELQKAIYSSLKTPTNRVFDLKQVNPIFPFIEIGQIIEFDESIKTHDRHQFNITVHTFTKGTSSIESKELNHFVRTQLLDLSLVTGFEIEYVKLLNSTTLIEPSQDGKSIFHGVMYFEISMNRAKQI